MGRVLATLALLLSGLLMRTAGLTPVRAEELPWCAELDVFTKNCAFTSYDECATVARNGGGRCIANPLYKEPAPTLHANIARPKASTNRH